MIFGINTTSDIYAKYHVQIMLLFVYTTTHKRVVIFTCRYFKLSWNTTALSQSNCRNFSSSSIKQIIAWFVAGIWHKYHSWYFKIVSNFTRLSARDIKCNNFEISSVVFMPNITTNHAITYTNRTHPVKWSHVRLCCSLTRYLSVFFDNSGKCSSITKSTTFLKENKKGRL